MSDHRLADDVVARCTSAGLSVAIAESLTGGLVCAAIADVPGASRVLRGGVVAYATELKASVLGVDAALIATRGPVDPDVARAMALGVRRLMGADVGLATTGVAGPTPQAGAAVGTVFVAVSWGGDSHASPEVEGLQAHHPGPDVVSTLSLRGSRREIRDETTAIALALLRDVVDGLDAQGREGARGSGC